MAEPAPQPLPPGSTIGILGGGQLGRMTAVAAAELGYQCHIFCPTPGEPATQVTPLSTIAAYDDKEALSRFAQAVDVVTYEFENVPGDTAGFLASQRPVRPNPNVLRICQNRLREKDFLSSISVPTTPYAGAEGPDALARAAQLLGLPAVLKTVEMGYDGKGQVLLAREADTTAAWREMAGAQSAAQGILEGFVDFELEISVIVARGLDGTVTTYPPVENRHRNHILDETIVPAPISSAIAKAAETHAHRIAEALDLVGLIGVEMFVTKDGRVLVNELAPRPHNSGHWTQDGCVTSQFEQFVRAVAGLPLGSTERHSDVVMKNLLGEEANDWRAILSDPAAKLHLYGKSEARPGRKMGHVNRLSPKR
jgi:5-(carboxyamino)imidazole ribonucleotide synthase